MNRVVARKLKLHAAKADGVLSIVSLKRKRKPMVLVKGDV